MVIEAANNSFFKSDSITATLNEIAYSQSYTEDNTWDNILFTTDDVIYLTITGSIANSIGVTFYKNESVIDTTYIRSGDGIELSSYDTITKIVLQLSTAIPEKS